MAVATPATHTLWEFAMKSGMTTAPAEPYPAGPCGSQMPPMSSRPRQSEVSTISEKTSDRRFKSAIDEEIAQFEAQRRAKEEDAECAKKQLHECRAKAINIRDKIIIPLLNDLRDGFAAEEKLLPVWEICSDANIDEFSASAVTPSLDAGGATVARYAITAKASVAESGVLLDFSVECSYIDPNNTSANKSVELHKQNLLVMALTIDSQWSRDKMYGMGQKYAALDMQQSRDWFQKQLIDCARKCARAKLDQVGRMPARPASRG
jgi:hypothetical protein